MKKGFIQLAITVISVLALALPVFAGQLDDHYLTAFGEKPGSALEKAIFSSAMEPAQAVRSGTPLRHSLKKDWDKLEPATQKVLAKQLAAPVLSGTEQVLTSPGGHFNIHYTTSGTDSPNIALINQYTGLGLTSINDWATQVANRFEDAYAFYLGTGGLGYHPPPNFPNTPFNVYLADLASQGVYGLTQSDQPAASADFPYAYSAFIQIDKDFTNSIFKPQTYTPLQSLQITSVHEFHHAIQYGYNFYFDIWYAETTSTWFEGELYPGVGQNYSYIPGWFSNSTRRLDLAQSDPTFNSQAYGRWIFNRYLAENHTTTVVRSIWEKLAGIAPINGQDIPMAPVLDTVLSTSYNSTLGADFFGFAKRVYTRDWSTHQADIARIANYSPISTFSVYPVNAGTAAASVTLPHYSFAYYKFTPSATTSTLNLSLSKTSGIQTAVFKKVNGAVSEVTANNGDTSYTVSGFNNLNPATDEVALLIANPTTVDSHQANFSTDGSNQPVTEPTGGSVYNSSSSGGGKTTNAGSSSGGGGCFIATAAYGSYLHPQVQVLRDFRDNYLLTNAPGRTFVAIYYHLSPPAAEFIARHAMLRLMVRLTLTPLVFAIIYPAAAGTVCLIVLAGTLLIVRRKATAIFLQLRS